MSPERSAIDSDDSIQAGAIIAGKYRITAVAGRGGMGKVMVAEHIQLQERVALKFLKVDSDQSSEFRARFLREAKVTAKLRGEHMTRLMDFGVTDGGAPYMVMEYLDGMDLRKVLREMRRIPVDLAVEYIVQVCEGLAEAHAHGIIHRDLKPSNLLITKRLDGTDLVKILDFGVSKLRMGTSDSELTEAGTILGSPRYAAPEQLMRSTDADERADIWSLGAIFYEMLTGESPFTGESAAEVMAHILSARPPIPVKARNPDVSAELDGVVLQCLKHDRNARPPNVAALVHGIARASKMDDLENVAIHIDNVLSEAARLQSEQSGGYDASPVSGERSTKRLGLRRTGSYSRPRTSIRAGDKSIPPGKDEDLSSAVTQMESGKLASRRAARRRQLGWGLGIVTAMVMIFVLGRKLSPVQPPHSVDPSNSAPPMATIALQPSAAATVAAPTVATDAQDASSPIVASSAPAADDSRRTAPRTGSSPRGNRAKTTGRSKSSQSQDVNSSPPVRTSGTQSAYEDRY